MYGPHSKIDRVGLAVEGKLFGSGLQGELERADILQQLRLESYQLKHRLYVARAFQGLCWLAATSAVGVLFFLLYTIVSSGWSWLSIDFLTRFPSRFPNQAGIKSAIVGSLWVIGLTAAFAIPLGLGAGIFLEEQMKATKIRAIIDQNIANLASVPSIVYGMLGLTLFVRLFELNRSVLAGAMTLAILVLPVIIMAAREALRAVPQSIREAALAVGATRWQTTRDHVLPSAFPGILTGVILGLSRAAGESAPLIMIGAMSFIAFTPEGPMDGFTVLPIQIYNWTARPQADFHDLASAAIIVLLVVLLSINALAIWLRNRMQRNNPCQNL